MGFLVSRFLEARAVSAESNRREMGFAYLKIFSATSLKPATNRSNPQEKCDSKRAVCRVNGIGLAL